MSSTPRRLIFTIDEPVFKTCPLFIIGGTHGQMRAYLRRKYRVQIDPEDKGPSKTVGTMLTFETRPWRVVWAAIARSRAETVATVAHEIVHLVTRICQDKGVPIRAYGYVRGRRELLDETAAYMIEFFLQRCLEKRI